jgi:radical SAM enzyme (TIGR01210 family)
MAEESSITEKDIQKAKKAQLKDMCETCGLATSGNKRELQDRLFAYISGETPSEEEIEEEAEEEPTPEEEIPEEELPEEEEEAEEEAPEEEPEEEAEEEEPPEEEPEEEEEAPEEEEEVEEEPPEEEPEEEEEAPEEEPEEEAPPPEDVVPAPPAKVERPCPTCGKELEFVEKYDRYYCYTCKSYAPREKPKPAVKAIAAVPVKEGKPCPTCKRPLKYIKEYDRWYCQSCGTYAPVTVREKKAPAAAKEPAKNCSTCGQPLRYISQYNRWYCNNCKAYEGVKKVEARPAGAPPAVKRCPTCGSNMKYVPKHRRYYCYSCQAYRPVKAAPKTMTVAVVPAGARAGARPAPGARPARARPAPTGLAASEAMPKDGLALAGSVLIMLGVILFIISGLMSLMVYSGSMDSVVLVESGEHRITMDGGLSGVVVDTSGPTPATFYTFNVLLFLALLFGGLGVALYGISLAKWLPRIGQKKSDKRIPSRSDVTEYVSCWTEKDVLNGEVVDAFVVILRTSGCSWARKKGCTMCGYFSDCHPGVTGKHLETQMTRALEKSNSQRILKIFTSGSFLDDREIPKEARNEMLSMASGKFEQVVVETRPEFVSRETLEECSSGVDGLQVALGLESANDMVLRHSINKGFLYDDYLRAAKIIKGTGATLKTYLLVKPPFLTEKEAIADTVNSATHIKDVTDVISINPVNVQRGTLVERLWRRGEYRPPWLWSVVRILEECRDLGPRTVSFPTGGGKKRGAHNCLKCDAQVLANIEEFSLRMRENFDERQCECVERWMDTLDLQGFTQSSIDIQRYYE